MFINHSMSGIGKPWPKEQIQPASVFVNRLYWNKLTLTVLWLLSHNNSKDEKLQQRLYVYHLAFYRKFTDSHSMSHSGTSVPQKTSPRVERHPTKKTPALSISNMTHVQNKSKKLSKTDVWIFKQWAKDLNRHFTKQISQMANSYERVLNSLVISNYNATQHYHKFTNKLKQDRHKTSKQQWESRESEFLCAACGSIGCRVTLESWHVLHTR